MNHNNSRRSFLKQAALATLATATPGLLMAAAKPYTRKIGPNEKVNLAFIGIGNRGGEIARELYKTGLANIVALCDVDMGAPHTLEVMKMFPNVPRFQDFRQMFDKMGNQIDAVSIGVPDFAHFPITMMAIGLGKHVYVEKPMARTFNEVELMMKAARKHPKVVTQMGNQGHSEANYFQFKAWTEAGIIKDVTAITAHMNSPRRWHGWNPNITAFPPAEQAPATLDWNIWQMATQGHSYNKDFVNGQWRCWFDFGMGALGDWGAHIIDTAHQFLDLGLPYEVDPVKLTGHNNFFYPMSTTLAFKFPQRGNMPALDITWYDGVDNLPPIPAGYGVSGLDPNIPPPSNGPITPAKLNPGKIIYSKDLTFKGGSHGSTLSIIPEEKAKEMAGKLPVVPASPSNHFKNFLLACKGEEQTRSPFAIAGPLSQVFCLGVLAQWTGEKLQFDREKKIITNNKHANELLIGPPPRKGWEQYYKV
ncbi:oxidoreductase family protein [Chitinophaga polysaccharea]|uniref:Oxidoreductase family protein n=1 Tax=Chitinophaga polysaccharea TaxID=1293035 RepID=A0A561PPH4_9BACT|nr:Gfo/Idh/MocA family oxidoreductase [Chitinophaga polysaccharea]TWF40016.1 oxidoreductase family protein [Chitinophaga polysaccharea]